MALERYQKAKHRLEEGELLVVYDRWTTKLSVYYRDGSQSPPADVSPLDVTDNDQLVSHSYMLWSFCSKGFNINGQEYLLKAYWLVLWGSKLLQQDKLVITELLPRRRAKSKAILLYLSCLTLARLGYVFYAI